MTITKARPAPLHTRFAALAALLLLLLAACGTPDAGTEAPPTLFG